LSTTSRCIAAAVTLAVWAWPGTSASAQSAASAANPVEAATGPMNCWWRTDKSAIRVGELVGLTLTCRMIETDRVTVVPNLSEIEPTAIQLAPFDVIEGARHDDMIVPPWRYVQYEYTLRLLGEEFFGRDVAIPPMNVRFRIQTAGIETVEGNEHTYVLPSMPVRIISLVPAQAADIRDAWPDTFGDIEARRFRATVAFLGAAISFGFAGLLVVVAAVRLTGRFRTRGPAIESTVPIRAVLRGCLNELEQVRADGLRDGWTPALAARALTPFRIAGAIALSQPVTQSVVARDWPAREGQLALKHGTLRRRRAVVSASLTTDTIDRLRAANGHGGTRVSDSRLDRIREVLAALGAVRYGRNGNVDTQELDRAVEEGIRALRGLRASQLWPRRAVASLGKFVTSARPA
jgi:hypothetical protein